MKKLALLLFSLASLTLFFSCDLLMQEQDEDYVGTWYHYDSGKFLL